VLDDEELPGSAFRVAYILAEHVNYNIEGEKRGSAWTTVELIAKRTKLSVRHVHKCIKALEDRGHFTVKHRRRMGNRYVPILPDDPTAIVNHCSLSEHNETVAKSVPHDNNKCTTEPLIVNPSSHHPLKSSDNPLTMANAEFDEAKENDKAQLLLSDRRGPTAPQRMDVAKLVARINLTMHGNDLYDKSVMVDPELPGAVAFMLGEDGDYSSTNILAIMDKLANTAKIPRWSK
jgi:hypothetical protein